METGRCASVEQYAQAGHRDVTVTISGVNHGQRRRKHKPKNDYSSICERAAIMIERQFLLSAADADVSLSGASGT